MSTSSPQRKQKRHASGATDLEPLSRRCLQTAGALSLLLLLVVVNSLLNDGSASPFNPNPVAAAAERTAEVPGMRIEMTMSMSTEAGHVVTILGKGAFSGDANLAEFSYDATSSEGKRLEFDAVLGESAWYFRYPQLGGRIPEGKEWMKLEGFPGQEDMSSPGVSPDESLQMLRGSGTVRRLGHARIGHVRTTRYRVTQTPAEIVDVLRSEGKDELADQVESSSSQAIGPVRSEVFIGQDGMLRRMRIESTEVVDGQQVTTKIRMNFFDFGIEPEIQIPDDSSVYDVTPLLQEKLDSLGQAS